MIKFLEDQEGISLIEIIILIIIVGVALPSLYTLNALIARYHAKNETIVQATSMADSRMEEIISFKKESQDWDKYISNYNENETLSGGFTRITKVTAVGGWGAEGLNGYEIEVTVTNTELENGYRLTAMLAE